MKKTMLIMFLLSITVLGIVIQTISTPGKAVAYSSLTKLIPRVMQTTPWQTDDTIILSLNKVDWTERRFNPQPSGAQAIGWIEFHQREHFVSYNDIFLDLNEKFDWDKLSSSKLWSDFGFHLQFPSWESFAQNITASTSWWLEWSWGLDTRWYGISANTTVIHTTKEGAIATITIWCHVSKVSEYLIGHSFEKVSFDLYSIDMGKMEIYEYYFDSTSSGQSVYLHFSAPSTILRQEGESFTAAVNVNPLRRNALSEDNRSIVIVMPPQSEVESINPSNLGTFKKNAATFTVSANDRLPTSFMVVSGPHKKDLTEMIIENFTSPDRILVMGGVVTVAFSGFQGMGMLRRRRTYNRTARLIAKIFHEYKATPDRLRQELSTLHVSLYRFFVENQITDEQFEKLLALVDRILKEELQA